MARNIYVHFPFCRSKCAYCALYSRTGATAAALKDYIESLSVELGSLRVRLGSNRVNVGSDRVESLNDPNLTLTDPNLTLTDPNSTLTDPNSTLSDPNSTLTDPNSTLSDPNSTLSDPNPTLNDPNQTLKTLYFGGGSPALCDLSPLRNILFDPNPTLIDPNPTLTDTNPTLIDPNPTLTAHNPTLTAPNPTLIDPNSTLTYPNLFEFTVELHPFDVTEAKLDELKSIGVNRISMGVQSLDDHILRAMGRGYTADDAERAFALVRSRFDNAGIDLIVGYPGESPDLVRRLSRLSAWGLRHCSVYSLQNERGLSGVPDDDTVLDRIREAAAFLKSIGLERYEISNYAVPGYECRHNLAVWRGEDYAGIGEGACGREGLRRTRGLRNGKYDVTSVTPEQDLKERTIFRLRTRDGLDASRFPEWIPTLDRFAAEGLLVRVPGSPSPIYRLTERGTEVCDSILTELV